MHITPSHESGRSNAAVFLSAAESVLNLALR